MALTWGWIPPVTVPWSANLMLLAGFIQLWRRRHVAAYRLGFAASLTALTTFLLCEAAALKIGYYLWQASFMVFTGSAILADRGRKPDLAGDDRLE